MEPIHPSLEKLPKTSACRPSQMYARLTVARCMDELMSPTSFCSSLASEALLKNLLILLRPATFAAFSSISVHLLSNVASIIESAHERHCNAPRQFIDYSLQPLWYLAPWIPPRKVYRSFQQIIGFLLEVDDALCGPRHDLRSVVSTRLETPMTPYLNLPEDLSEGVEAGRKTGNGKGARHFFTYAEDDDCKVESVMFQMPVSTLGCVTGWMFC